VAVCGATLAEVAFPPGASAVLVVRDQQLIAARGHTQLLEGDHVYVFCQAEDEPLIGLMFGDAMNA
jgi:NhaP-type Na+/H+ and K+/H+ antiporter